MGPPRSLEMTIPYFQLVIAFSGGDADGPVPDPVEIEFEGKTYAATYVVANGWLTLNSIWGSKNAKAGPGPHGIAGILLYEILTDAKRRRVL